MARTAILKKKAHTVAVLRLVMTLAICGMALPRLPDLGAFPLVLLSLYVLTSVLLFTGPIERQIRRMPHALLFILDLLMVVLLMNLSGATDSEFYVMFFLIILMAALARSATAAAAIAFISAVLYGLIVGVDQPADLLEMEFTTRVSFFFVVALFAGYLAEEVQKEREGHRHFQGFYRTLFDESAYGILFAGADGVITDANSRACRLLVANPVGLPWKKLIGVEGLPAARVATPPPFPAERPPAEAVFSVDVPRPGQDPVRCDVTLKQFSVAGTPYTLVMLCDVSLTRRMQDRILELEKMSALGRLVSSITHEINNPLTAVLGWAELLDDSDFPDEARQFARSIAEAGKHCKSVIENTLSHYRTKTFEAREVPVAEVLRATENLMEYHLRYHLVTLTVALQGEPVVYGDPRQLEQLLINLMCNSVQAMSGGSIRRLDVSVSTGTDRVKIELSDTGPGIPPDVLAQLFQPGFTTKALGEGHGLGLSLCHEIVQRHGGSITVESQVGVGTKFIILLPTASSTPQGSVPDLASARAPEAL